MSTEVAVRERQAVTLTNEQLKYIASSEFVPQGLRGNLPAILACVTTGRALGIDDMSSLRLIHVVNGRPTFSAELMVQLARRAGHSITGEVDSEKAVVKGRRADNGDEMKVTWTMEMGRRAGLANKATWKSYPESLLWARAVSQLCRMLFADVFAGGTYTQEEMGGDGMGDAEEFERRRTEAFEVIEAQSTERQDSPDERAVSQPEGQPEGGSGDQEPEVTARTPAPSDFQPPLDVA